MKKLLFLVSILIPTLGLAEPLTRIEITSQNGHRTVFMVEVVTTPEAMQKGLMGRTRLAADRGMLFDFTATQPVTMWMKNTLIPLDMLFIKADNTIVFIAENTTPESLDKITAGQPVRYVLELKGGTARRANIRVGDRLIVP